jgi:hypothetical protein
MIKGGPGSGNWGHAGVPGRRGGSAPGGGRSFRPADFASRGSGAVAEPPKPEKKPFKGAVNYSASPNIRQEILDGMRSFGVTEDDVKDMCNWPGDEDVTATVKVSGDEDHLSLETYWEDKNGERFGYMKRDFRRKDNDKVDVHHSRLRIEGRYQDRDIADKLYKAQFEVYKKAGVDTVSIYADISIGKYAWARKGFQYESSSEPEEQTAKFKRWCEDKGVELDSYPTFRTPQDVANFKAPGWKIYSSDIYNHAIKTGDYDLGKAFMLDSNGHGDWEGSIWLK